MKQFLIVRVGCALSVILVGILFASCSKDSNGTDTSTGMVQYKVNGNLVTFKNSRAPGVLVKFTKEPQINFGFGGYFLRATKAGESYLALGIKSDSLAVGNYNFTCNSNPIDEMTAPVYASVRYLDVRSTALYTGDNISINITSYSNELISGNFTAKLSPYYTIFGQPLDSSTRGTIVITEGEFKDVKCYYY